MVDEGLKTGMISRLGRSCNENIMLVDKTQHIITEKKEKPGREDGGLIASYNRTFARNWVNLKDILKDKQVTEEDNNEKQHKISNLLKKETSPPHYLVFDVNDSN